MKEIRHKHLIVRAEVENPPGEFGIMDLKLWFRALIENLGMKLLSGPHICYVTVAGNKGVTGVAIIETSHVAMHVWDEKRPALMQVDVYTCGDLNPRIVLDAIQEFQPIKVEYKFLDREHGLREIE